jgi:hypothetical protein
MAERVREEAVAGAKHHYRCVRLAPQLLDRLPRLGLD